MAASSSSTMLHTSLIPVYQSNRLNSIVRSPNVVTDQPSTCSLANALSSLLHLHIVNPPNKIDNVLQISKREFHCKHKISTPTNSPKEAISGKSHEIHGSSDWKNMLDPLHPWLRREIIKYGEFAQATYDAFDSDSFSEYCGSCRYNKKKLFEALGLTQNGYKVVDYVYAMAHAEIPRWLERSHVLDPWSKDSNWMGYVAVSNDEESRRIGRRDIVVAWRGTMMPAEWFKDFQRKLEPVGHDGDAKVEHGFLSIYRSKSGSTRYNKTSASEQVMRTINKVVAFYGERGEEVSLTVTGHSLGGALALLNAHEVASTIPSLPVSVVSFAAPRVGNHAFRDELNALGVKTLRVVVKQDLVPKMPGIVFNEGLQKFEEITGTWQWVYTHAGSALELDVTSSPYLKHGFNLIGFHSLETYLHLVDGFLSSRCGFRADAKRDIALVNKACDMLVDGMRIPKSWYQLANKGLVCNEHGRWVQPERDPEDIPSPITREHHLRDLVIDTTDNNQGLGSFYGLGYLG